MDILANVTVEKCTNLRSIILSNCQTVDKLTKPDQSYILPFPSIQDAAHPAFQYINFRDHQEFSFMPRATLSDIHKQINDAFFSRTIVPDTLERVVKKDTSTTGYSYTEILLYSAITYIIF
jgi:hypothetical protein